jgi:hypothetical protein
MSCIRAKTRDGLWACSRNSHGGVTVASLAGPWGSLGGQHLTGVLLPRLEESFRIVCALAAAAVAAAAVVAGIGRRCRGHRHRRNRRRHYPPSPPSTAIETTRNDSQSQAVQLRPL